MSVRKIFKLENEIGTKTKYDSQTTEMTSSSIGICVALSSLWCSNVLKLGMAQSRPDYLRAGLLQGLYERMPKSNGSDLRALYDPLGIKTTSSFQMPGKQAIEYLRSRQGLFMLRYPGHAMAAQVGNSGYYFLDPEEGLYQCSSGSAFEHQIWKLYKNERKNMWTCQAIAAN